MAECAVLLGVSAAVDEEKKTWLEPSLKQNGSRQNSAEKQCVSAERDDNRRPLRLEIEPTDTAFSTGGEHRNLMMGRTELRERERRRVEPSGERGARPQALASSIG